jgi:hypothetical protein
MAREKHPTLPRTRKPMPPTGTPEHQEWLVDEAGEESFPASDPSTPSQPGGTPDVGKARPKKK